MEQENLNKQKPIIQIPNDLEILQLIQKTYNSKNTAEVTQAQSILNQLLTVDRFIQKLFYFFQNQDVLQIKFTHIKQDSLNQFKTSISILIKKFSYQFSKKQNQSKQILVEKLFSLLISKLNVKAKQQLGTALQYILNHDAQSVYRPKVIEKIAQILDNKIQDFVVEGSLIISQACLNSLIEAEDQFNFIWKILDNLITNAAYILQELKNQPQQNLHFQKYKKKFKLSRRIFDLLELAFSRVLDQQDFIGQKIDELRNHPALQMLFFSYLINFGYRKSILSTIPQINQVKQIVVQIIFGLYKTRPMPQNIFNLFFVTLLLQSQRQSYEQQQEHIVTRILQLLQSYMQDKFYLQTFLEHKMQLLMSMLMYSVTKPEEFDMMEEEPQRFVELSEEFTEGFKGSVNIKVRAASFLRVFAAKFDQALRNILQIIVIIITASMETDDPQSPCLELYKSLQQQFPEFQFFKLQQSYQVETCFNILSLLSIYITKREDLNKIVYAILVTHYNKLQNIEKPIVLLRLIRLIGYYPTAIYYNFIKMKMNLGKVFVLQGLKSFQRILKANRYPEIFEVLGELFSELVHIINVTDTIFQSIILNHYERILKKNLKLFESFLMKIRDTFIENLQKSQHLSFVCLSYIYSMLNKQNDVTDKKFKIQITQYFYSMEQYYTKTIQFYSQKVLQNIDFATLQTSKKILKNLQNYQEKIIDIYSILIKKQIDMSQRMIQFAVTKLKTIGTHNKNEQIFRLYNNLFLKIQKQFGDVSVFYNAFMNEIRLMFAPLIDPNHIQERDTSSTHKLQILPNLSYLISQLFGSFYDIHLSKEDLTWMVKILSSLTQDVRQYILLIIMSYAYVQPVKLKQILQQVNLYEQTLKFLLTTNYNQKLIRKIFLLSMSKLLEIEQQYFQDILRQCIKYFKEQFKQNETKPKRKQHIDPKLRRYLQQGDVEDQQQMREQKKKQDLSSSVSEFKHPFYAMSEYDQFKIRVWQNYQIVQKLSEADKNQLRGILQMDWFGKGVRKIVSVKQGFSNNLQF